MFMLLTLQLAYNPAPVVETFFICWSVFGAVSSLASAVADMVHFDLSLSVLTLLGMNLSLVDSYV